MTEGDAIYVKEHQECTSCLGTDDEPAERLWVRMTRQTNIGSIVIGAHYRLPDQDIIMDKLMKHGLGKWTVRWVENWLNCQAQRVMSSSMKSSWRPVH